MALDPRRVKALFNSALDLPTPGERSAFLDRECGEDPELRRRLVDLLAAHDKPSSALERPLSTDPDAAASPPATEPDQTGAWAGQPGVDPEQTHAAVPEDAAAGSIIGAVIAGRYTIREEIGEGGMGCVYLADQTNPVKRRVAIKLIKAGMDTRTVLARFESERQALALMDHPNIAKFFDAGATERGRPFFVMELVNGVPLNDYCDQNRLSLPERLALFGQICSAVQHAHQKGIIHRDLKPTNILVESHDGRPVPKVIDFGLAKATSGQPLADQSLYTALGAVNGTPLYMAPEQASFNALDVDTRADVYSLGVILYELLAGSTPIKYETLRRAGFEEMLRAIREVEPPTPSSRISTSEALPSVAAARHIEPGRLRRFVRGELDWVVMKALAKERHRRYDSAIGLANDVERFINQEPVSAGPPTASYRFRKFVQRNRPQVIAAAMVLLTLVGGIIGTTLGLIRAETQRRAAEQARTAETAQRIEAEAQHEKALAAERRATLEAAKATAVNEFLTQDLLMQAEPANNAAEDKVTLIEVLDRAAERVGERFADQPEVAVELRETIAHTYHGLASWEKAEKQWRAVLEMARKADPKSASRYRAQGQLAHILRHQGRNDSKTLAMEQEAADGLARILGPDHPETFAAMGNLASAYQAAGRLDRALPLFEETLTLSKARLGPDHLNTLTVMGNLAGAYKAAGRLDRALPLFEETLPLMKAKLGPDHPDTLVDMSNLAAAYQAAGRLDRALSLLEETLPRMQAKVGPNHHVTLIAMNNLASIYQAAGRLDRARPLVQELLKLTTANSGVAHPDTLHAMGFLGAIDLSTGRLDEAIPLLDKAYRAGCEHPELKRFAYPLMAAYMQAGRHDEAASLAKQGLADIRTSLPADSLQLARVLAQAGLALLTAESWTEAEPIFREVLAICEAQEPDAWTTFCTRVMLGEALLGQKKYSEAEPLLRSGYEGMKRRAAKIPAPGRTRLSEALDRLIKLAEATDKPDDVKMWEEEKAKLNDPSIPKPRSKIK